MIAFFLAPSHVAAAAQIGASAVAPGSVLFALMDETFAQRAYLVLQHPVTKDVSSYSDAELDAMAFDPDEVTALAGLAPTTSYRRGEPDGLARRSSGWEYSTPVMDTMITDDVVTALLDRIDPFGLFELGGGLRVG
ncbi:DUF4279 domain-containing protein [Dactylosporangium sp. CA-233914]|uniref:DUF4279 domain-containing protein n=1 Tax=Dactylosporangium sp. CA-233914 TaxID=3239934 RepID=UPI003D8C07E7